jgi:DNA invertase Pin-like site-specific DNA recombinase
MGTTAAYVRVSTVGQNEAGQRREIEKWLKGNDVTGVRWYVDKKSGDNLDRPEFNRLQQDIFNGEVRTVVCYKLDRLSRTIQDGINVLCEWCKKGLRVVSVTQTIDFNGGAGTLIAAVLFAVAQMEQETRRERQRVGIEVAKEQGKYKGRKPGATKAKPQRAKQLRDKGLTIDEIATALNVSRMTVHRYLNSSKAAGNRRTAKPIAAAERS